jgi:hypothetical protein
MPRQPGWNHPRLLALSRVILFSGLAVFYVIAASEHARIVNTSKARADQSGYLWDAEQVYFNWHGRQPPWLIGERMRMPGYAAVLALAYNPRMTDPEFFEVAKIWNIRLSVVLLALLAIVFAWELPPLIATNLTLVVAFGYFVFRAGYPQPELLFYTAFFLTFLTCYHLFAPLRPSRLVGLGIIAGVLSGLSDLTKAVMPPFVGLFCAAFVGEAVLSTLWRHQPRVGGSSANTARPSLLWRIAAGAAMAVVFLAVVYPYVANSERVFGQYFFNANTTYYIWYDSGAEARAVLLPLTDTQGVVRVPADRLPSARTYWRSHTVAQILGRLGHGFEDMAIRSYRTFWYLKYLTIYSGLALILIVTNWDAFVAVVQANPGLMAFLVMYGATYSVSTAFFEPTSGTGTTRFLLAHVAPYLFVLSRLFARTPFADTRWRLGPVVVRATYLHALVLLSLGYDLTFTIWTRLMTTYGGF